MIHILPLLVIILLRSNPVIPSDTVVLVGDSTALGCNSSETFVFWIHTTLEGKVEHFYRNKSIIPRYTRLGLSMETNQELSERNLKIKNVTTAIAGQYECDSRDGKRKSTELIVLEKLPECSVNMDTFIGPNDCNIPLDDIQLSCSVRYRGNKSPELEWGKFGDSEVLKSNCTTENDYQRTCNLTVKADLDLHNSSFVCQTTERAAKEQYNCTTKPITILHSFSSDKLQQTTLPKGDEVVCVANSSMSCTYKWVRYETVDDDENRNIESKNNVLVAKKIGSHRCEAKCNLRNQTCLVFPKYIEVYSSDNNLNHSEDASPQNSQPLQQENKQWTPAVIALLILGVLPYFAFGGYLLTRRRRKRTLARDRIPANEYDS